VRPKEIGEVVAFRIAGKVAEKRDGVITGRWISFEEGDVGKIVGVRYISGNGRDSGQKVYEIVLQGGVIRLRSNNVSFMRDSEISIPFDALMKADPDARVRAEDLDVEGDPEY